MSLNLSSIHFSESCEWLYRISANWLYTRSRRPKTIATDHVQITMSQLSPGSNTPQRAVRAFLVAWLVAGTLDISAAIAVYSGAYGVNVAGLLQGIASGVLGDQAFVGGHATALLGLALHYLIALIWTLIFFVLSRSSKWLIRNLFLTGIAYGVVVWFVMNVIVLPLSNVRRAPFTWTQAIISASILMLCIGIPIATIVGKYRRV